MSSRNAWLDSVLVGTASIPENPVLQPERGDGEQQQEPDTAASQATGSPHDGARDAIPERVALDRVAADAALLDLVAEQREHRRAAA